MGAAKVVADKIVGIVGDKIILNREIFIANEDIKRQGGQEQEWLPDPRWDACAEGTRSAGRKDSIPVTEEEIDRK